MSPQCLTNLRVDDLFESTWRRGYTAPCLLVPFLQDLCAPIIPGGRDVRLLMDRS
jgi:hypothetical protein